MASNEKMWSNLKTLQQQVTALRAENARLKAACKIRGTHILSLPTELLDRIFVQLSDQQEHIAACRLVCRKFKDVSSPYLITSVTFSRRMDTLSKLFDVLEHKYFSQYVTELVWDASWWDERLTLNFEDYHHNASVIGRSYPNRTVNIEEETWKALWSRLSPYCTDLMFAESQYDFGHLDNGMEYKTAFLDSYHLGFHQYTRFWLAQKAMEDRGVPKDTLTACVKGFPKLRSLTARGWCMVDAERPQAISHRHLSSDITSIDVPPLVKKVLKAFESIRHLRLPQKFSFLNDESEGHVERTIKSSIMPMLLTLCADNLVKLIFTAEDLIYFHDQYGTPSHWVVRDGGELALETIFYPVTFKALRYLDFCGWPLQRCNFEGFLQRHSTTLRQVRLLGNLVMDGKPCADNALASWMGANLKLEGIAVANHPGDWRQQPEWTGSFPCMREADAYFEITQTSELENLSLAGRSNLLEKAQLPRDRRRMTDRYTSWRNDEGWAE